MDITPVVTYAGDRLLFQGLETSLLQAIPKEATEWRRQYRRVNKSVSLKAKFVPFSKDLLPKSGEWKLIGMPILHTYWTECTDLDTYKTSLKGDIENWLKSLAGGDFMIILVEVYDVRKSNKLLPRTTVLDKIRTDFALKQGDRVLGLIHPVKSESKSAESWRGLVGRVRVLMLSAYSKILSKFEEAIRACRECRPQPNWSFCNYFIMQEELALVLEMLGIFDEALVQYDELDALFTQFVVNSSKGDYPKWLASFTVPLQRWSGMNLKETVTAAKRDLIRYSKFDLLQFRSYLFSRQCSLLIQLKQPQELARRTLPFLYNCLSELSILEVSAPDGAVSAWVFLICLEVINACESGFKGAAEVREYSAYTAGLWAYARDKLAQLGQLCGVVPNPETAYAVPNSHHLHVVVQLASGMDDIDEHDANAITPVQRLKLALSSNQAFNAYFMELSELSIGTYKHIGRLRSARYVGLDLAKFYIALNQPDKAVPFLSAALSGFEDDKWDPLAADIQLQLVECFASPTPDIKYLSSCLAVACSDLDNATKLKYYHKFIDSINKIAQGPPIISHLRDLGCITDIKIVLRNKISRGKCQIIAHLDFFSRLPGPIDCDYFRISIEKGATLDEEKRVENECCNVFDKRLPMNELLEYKQDGRLCSTSIVCRDSQKALLTRKESNTRKSSLVPNQSPSNEYFVTESPSITLNPNDNNFQLSWEGKDTGRFVVGQISLKFRSLVLLASFPKKIEFFVDQQSSSVIVETKPKLLAGLPQSIVINIDLGSYFIPQGTLIHITCSKGLLAGLSDEKGWTSNLDVSLPECQPFTRTSISLSVLADLAAQKEPDLPEWTHTILIKCDWCELESSTNLQFTPPLKTSTRLHTIVERKMIQISVSGLTEQRIVLRSPRLAADTDDVNLIDINAEEGLPTMVSNGLTANYLWELHLQTSCSQSKPVDPLGLTFHLEYSPDADSGLTNCCVSLKYKCHFQISNYKTLFYIRCTLDAGKENEFCRVGAICHLSVEISRHFSGQMKNESASIMYELSADQSLWAICGRAAGVMTLDKETSQTVNIEVMPLIQGYLSLPQIRLSRYFPASEKDSGSRPHLNSFNPGEVYNCTKSQQVHILPALSE